MTHLDINTLHRRGALLEGAISTPGGGPAGLPQGRKDAALIAGLGVLYWRGQAIEWEWQPIIARNPPPSWGASSWRARPRFLCPECGAGAYRLHAHKGSFACAKCAGYRPSRQDQRDPRASLLRCWAKAQAALGMSGSPMLADLPPPPRAPRSRWLYYRRAIKLRLIELRLLGEPLEDFLGRNEPPAQHEAFVMTRGP